MAYAAGTSFNQRKSLGRRYAVDPALQLEYDRLNQEYSLVPGREARALNESQFARGLDVQESANKQAGISGMIGAAGNIATTGMMLNAFRGKPPWGDTINNWMTPSPTIAPATVDAVAGLGGGSASANAAATATQVGAAGGEGGPAVAAGMTPGGMAATGAQAAGAGYLGYKAGEELGRYSPVGGEKEKNIGSYAGSGAAAGAVIGSAVPGVGTAIGAGVGAVVGTVVGIAKNTWICTATNKHVGTSKEQKASLKKLRRYAKENHPGWLEFYNLNGPALIKAIENEESDLLLFYGNVKRSLVIPCVRHIDKGDLGLAFILYRDKTAALFNKYMPDVEIKEVF